MTNPPDNSGELKDQIRKLVNRVRVEYAYPEAAPSDEYEDALKSGIYALITSQLSAQVEQRLKWWADDIEHCFKPICTNCKRMAKEQTTKGKHAQEALHRPVNWGYYCTKCADEGRELEREAMYG